MTDTITLPRAVVQGALEALESSDESSCDEFVAAIDALREALEQPRREWEYAMQICLDYHRAGGTAWDCWNALRMKYEAK